MQWLGTLTIPQMIICIIAAVGIIAAVIAFIRTPASERFSIKEPTREPGVEYAPMYSKSERKIILIKGFSFLVPAYVFMEYWFFPKMTEYASEANCHIYGAFTGVHVVFYGTFVGIPLLSFFMLSPLLINTIKVLKVGQYPLPGEKVMQLTKYRYGILARLQASLGAILVCSFLVIAIWGVGAANKNIEIAKPCAANKSLKDAP